MRRPSLISWEKLCLTLTGCELNVYAFRSFPIETSTFNTYPHYDNATKRVVIRVCLN